MALVPLPSARYRIAWIRERQRYAVSGTCSQLLRGGGRVAACYAVLRGSAVFAQPRGWVADNFMGEERAGVDAEARGSSMMLSEVSPLPMTMGFGSVTCGGASCASRRECRRRARTLRSRRRSGL